jgi:DNA-binding response OmpR family regulator
VPFAVLSILASYRSGERCRPITRHTIKEDIDCRPDFPPCKDVQDTVYKLRKAIAAAFQAAGRVIRPGKEILVSTRMGDTSAYHLVARVMDWATEAAMPPAWRVLVVEDDVELWQQPVAERLRLHGYKVAVAAPVQEAVAVARQFRPQFLCLDLCLPDAPGSALDPQAGIRVLRQVKADLPDVRAVLLTSLADNDLMRGEAGQYGIGPEDVVPKRESLEQTAGDLVLRLWRAELEVQRQARLPLPHLLEPPYLQLRMDRAQDTEEHLAEVRVFGERWRLTQHEGKLVLLLARRLGRSVPQQDICNTIWLDNEKVDTASALRSLVKRLHERIATEWPRIKHLPSARAMEVAHAILANDGKEGYVLNARVDWQDSPDAAPPD